LKQKADLKFTEQSDLAVTCLLEVFSSDLSRTVGYPDTWFYSVSSGDFIRLS